MTTTGSREAIPLLPQGIELMAEGDKIWLGIRVVVSVKLHVSVLVELHQGHPGVVRIGLQLRMVACIGGRSGKAIKGLLYMPSSQVSTSEGTFASMGMVIRLFWTIHGEDAVLVAVESHSKWR